MITARECWWCGRKADVDISLPESNGLVRDDSSFDPAAETWICTDSSACTGRALLRWAEEGKHDPAS